MKNVRTDGRSPAEIAPIDRAILDVLRRDARTPNNAVAAQVGIAPSTCLGRIRRLEQSGTILGYHADVDLDASGTPLQAMIAVRFRAGARHQLGDFTDHMRSRREVISVYFVAGNEDFLVHVAVRDTAALREFVLEQLSAVPQVAATQTSLIFEHARGAAWSRTAT